jgi:hypothetical protein
VQKASQEKGGQEKGGGPADGWRSVMEFILLATETSSQKQGSILNGWDLASAVFAYVLTRAAWEICETKLKRSQLTNILCSEAVGTIFKLKPVLADFKNASKNRPKDRFSAVSILPCAAIFAGVPADLNQILPLIPKKRAITFANFLDRWARLNLQSSLYAAVYNQALVAASNDVTTECDNRLCDEYIRQLHGLANQIFQLGNQLCHVSCEIIDVYAPINNGKFAAFAEGLWETWEQHHEAMTQFALAAKAVLFEDWQSPDV